MYKHNYSSHCPTTTSGVQTQLFKSPYVPVRPQPLVYKHNYSSPLRTCPTTTSGVQTQLFKSPYVPVRPQPLVYKHNSPYVPVRPQPLVYKRTRGIEFHHAPPYPQWDSVSWFQMRHIHSINGIMMNPSLELLSSFSENSIGTAIQEGI